MKGILLKIKYIIVWYFFGGKQRATEFARQRIENQKHCFDFPSENNGWHKIGGAPVYGNEETKQVFDPFVYYEDEKFVMIVSERKYHSIIRLDSIDGINWKKNSVLLLPKKNTWQHIVNRATLVRQGNLWHMWYTGQFDGVASIGHAISRDGLSFKNAQRPCVVAEMKKEGVSVMNPCVLWNEHKRVFQMWYAAGENYEPDAIFYAESQDGEIWVKHRDPVLTKFPYHEWEKAKVGGCDVKIMPDGTYEMYYIGYQNIDVARICYATSKDGINWFRPDNNLLLAPSLNRFDSDSTYKPAVLEFEGKLYMWYNGRHNHDEYIGLAIKEI